MAQYPNIRAKFVAVIKKNAQLVKLSVPLCGIMLKQVRWYGRYLEQAKKDVALISTRHEVLGLEQQRVWNCECRPGPANELRDVVSRLE